MIVDPFRAGRQAGRSDLVVLLAVHVPADRVGLPFHGVHVEIVAEPLPGRQSEGRTDPVPPGITGSVNSAMYRGGLSADILHDVDLAAVRPSRGAVSHNPERRPD